MNSFNLLGRACLFLKLLNIVFNFNLTLDLQEGKRANENVQFFFSISKKYWSEHFYSCAALEVNELACFAALEVNELTCCELIFLSYILVLWFCEDNYYLYASSKLGEVS